ncbi:MAG: preprotein translocase subunit SecD, partial [Alicyclobacillus sp. RIFOXYA1_FULL_53_8]
MKYGRFGTFLAIVVIIVGLTAGTYATIWHAIPLGLDLKGGISVLYRIDPDKGQTLTKAGIQAALQAVETRVNSLGVSSPIINLENGDEINVQIAGVANPQNAEQVIGQTAQLSIYSQITTDKNGQPTPVKSSLLITGNDIANNASVGQNQLGQSVVDITLKNKGQWTDITKKYFDQIIYTFLNGKMIDSAQVRAIIANGQTAIGPFATIAQSQTLAQQLNAGALPYPLKLMSYTNVGPQLGAASLKATLDAALIAVILIFLFMIVNYRIAGLIADIALVAYVYLTLLVFAAFPITLTLSGLAALV